MIFNGGKRRIEANIDFQEFYNMLEDYYDSKLRSEHQKNLNPNFLDREMFDNIFTNLFRLLMEDLFNTTLRTQEDQNSV